LFDSTWTVKALVRFHTAHKLIVMAHSPEAYRHLGRLTAAAAGRPRAEVARRYEERFMKALAVIAPPRRHTHTLQHMLGYFKGRPGRESKAELAAALCRFHLIVKWR
jgi:uncharacterized protein YbgA (DUF1722 family)